MDFGTKYGICLANTLDILQSYAKPLTHLPQCCIYTSVNWDSINSDNGLSPIRRQAII